MTESGRAQLDCEVKKEEGEANGCLHLTSLVNVLIADNVPGVCQ